MPIIPQYRDEALMKQFEVALSQEWFRPPSLCSVNFSQECFSGTHETVRIEEGSFPWVLISLLILKAQLMLQQHSTYDQTNQSHEA